MNQIFEEADVIKDNQTTYTAICLNLELAAAGDLMYYISYGRLEEPIARFFFHEMIRGIEYMHS